MDPGDAEDGYVGNGTPALARDPREVVLTAVPLGCARKAPLPTPAHVLEVDYRFHDTSVIALRMRFDDEATARTFHDNRRTNLLACRGRSGGSAIGVLVGKVQRIGRTVLLSDRTPDSAPWTELAALDSRDVVLVAAQSRPGRPPFTPARTRDLAARFRPRPSAPAHEEGPTP